MEDREGLVRFLGFTILVTSAVSALCLGLLAFTFATGDLPYGIQPLLRLPAGNADSAGHPRPAAQAAAATTAKATLEARSGEYFAQRLFADLDTARQAMEQEKARLAAERRVVEQLRENERLLQAETQKAISRLENLLDTITAQEEANAKQAAGVLTQAENGEAVKLLLAMDERVAARVIFFLPPKRAGELFSAMMKSGDADSGKRAAAIMERMHKLRQESRS